MTVSITRTADATTIDWERGDDPQGYLVQAIDTGRLEAALTALGLSDYADIAAMDEYERAEALRGTAALVAELTRRVRSMTVACREGGMTWGTLASAVTGDPEARSTARSTYEAGLRQLGTPPVRMTTYKWTADRITTADGDPLPGSMTGSVTSVTKEAARLSIESQLRKKGWTLGTLTLTPVLWTED
ncbi:hypothetical protein [Streptomyces liangshanensis]|uniref:hypothetical protein n=1 Tax=Streptomyces liangshanensis TaxID=2717324 RepID=UPI0036DAC418